MDVERTIEFILEQQARLQTAFEEREALARRTDARLDRAIRLGIEEMRRERKRREEMRKELEERDRQLEAGMIDLQAGMKEVQAGLKRLEETVDRYISSRGNGSNGH